MAIVLTTPVVGVGRGCNYGKIDVWHHPSHGNPVGGDLQPNVPEGPGKRGADGVNQFRRGPAAGIRRLPKPKLGQHFTRLHDELERYVDPPG